MNVAKALVRFTDHLIEFLHYVCCIYTLIIAVACVLQVFSRYILQTAFPWTEETGRLAWISLGMMGIPVALRKGAHVKIDVIASQLKGTARKIQQVIMYLLVGFGASLFVVEGTKYLRMVAGSKGTAMRFFPMEIVYCLIPFGGAVCLLVCCVEILTILCPGIKDQGK